MSAPTSTKEEQNSKWEPILKYWLIRRSSWVAAFLATLAGIGFYFGSQIELKLSLSDLLPDNHPSVVQFNKLTDVVGGVGFFTIVLDAEDGKSHIESAPKVVAKLSESSLVRSVSFLRERRFFVDRLLYYMDLKALGELERNLKDQILKTRQSIIDLGLFDDGADNDKEEKKEIFSGNLKEMAKKSASITPYLTSKDGKHLLIMVKPSFDSTDLAKTKELADVSEKLLKETLPPQVKYRFAERYYNKLIETQMIEGDIYLLGSVSIIGIALILLLYLRSFRALLVIFGPVFIGIGLMVGLTYAVIGHINIVTGFLMGIVSGLGVDYGIHLLLRLRLEKNEPSSSDPDPVWRVLESSGHSVFVGATAAAVAFYLLCFSSFRAFSEFGFICGTGIVAVFASLMGSFAFLSRFVNLEKLHVTERGFRFPVLPLPKVFWTSVGFTGFLILAGAWVHFEYDFDRMMRHSKEMEELSELVDAVYERSAVPSALSIPTKEEALAVEKEIKDRYMPKLVSEMVSGATIVPDDQTEKKAILSRMQADLASVPDTWIKKALGVDASVVRRWLVAEPFQINQIPQHVQDSLRGTKQQGYLIYAYPAVKLGTAKTIHEYADMIRTLQAKFPSILTGSDAVIFSDILHLIRRDGTLILAVIFLAVGLFIWINVRKWGDTLLSYLPLLVALPVGMGLMTLFDVKFNIFNIAIIPSFVAMGIDVPIHIVHRARETGSGFKAARDLATSINLALLTAAVGFGCLVFARAGVLKSLGWIALLGTAAIWWIGLFVLPAFLEWMMQRKQAHSPSN